ncbi:MAG: nickel pincer cofactor biosynthesis protein LarC [Verrucomicrobia bacterium]|nr:nickel pincer cofactor biosynthesis protein LarC [Verrucomicrobiota bacterium]
MRILYLDCFSGISGNMLVGALTDLGVAPSAFEWELGKLALEDHHLHFDRQERKGISGVHFSVHAGTVHVHPEAESRQTHDEHEHKHGHDDPLQHETGAAAHLQYLKRSYHDIMSLIEKSDLSDFTKAHTLGVFRRLAVAEAKIHGCAVDEVHFHEVGALDSIVDVVLGCVGLEHLRVEEVHFSSLIEGQGSIRCAHGQYPVPSPATIEILQGIPIAQIPLPFELITPTGAAFVAEFQKSVGPFPALRPIKTGYGLGTRDLPDRANVLRAILGEKVETSNSERLVEVQATIDDMSPELLGAAIEKIRGTTGVLEAFFIPVQMKKSRPGMLLTAVCRRENSTEIQETILRHTSTFGVRCHPVDRVILDRKSVDIQTDYGLVSVKLGLFRGEVIQASPEFESCREAADRAGVPVRAVFDAAVQGFLAGKTC